MEDYVVVQFSGGKDSTAMLLRMIELGDHIDEVVNIDMGMEFPEMYEHVEIVRKYVEEKGIKYTVLKPEKSFEYWMFEHPIDSEKYGLHYGYGWPSMHCRWCTKIKMQLSDSYFKKLKEDHNIIQCIGLAADETKRLARPNNQRNNHRHPLVEWNWTEADCLQYCRDHGFNWNGLYDKFNRVSCWCCPLARISELRTLYENYPELWAILESWETILSQPDVGKRGKKFWFKDHLSVFDLSRRFSRELKANREQTKLDCYITFKEA